VDESCVEHLGVTCENHVKRKASHGGGGECIGVSACRRRGVFGRLQRKARCAPRGFFATQIPLCGLLCDAFLFAGVLARDAKLFTTPLRRPAPTPTRRYVPPPPPCDALLFARVLARDAKVLLRSYADTPVRRHVPPRPLSPTMLLHSKRPGAWLRPRSKVKFSRCGRRCPSTPPRLCLA
jgi:hypothetical protein